MTRQPEEKQRQGGAAGVPKSQRKNLKRAAKMGILPRSVTVSGATGLLALTAVGLGYVGLEDSAYAQDLSIHSYSSMDSSLPSYTEVNDFNLGTYELNSSTYSSNESGLVSLLDNGTVLVSNPMIKY